MIRDDKKDNVHHTHAIAGSSGSNISSVPKVSRGLTIVDATLKPSRFTARLNVNIPKILHVDLNTVEGTKTLGVTMSTVYSQEVETVFITVCDLGSLSANRTHTIILITLTIVDISDSSPGSITT